MFSSYASRVTLLLAVIIAMALTPLLARPYTPRALAAGDCTVDASLDSEERVFLTLINDYRAQNALPPLSASYTLTKASAWKSVDLGANRYFAHDDLTRTWVQRIRDCGYGFNAYIGENMAAGVTTGQQAFDIWRNSPGHNANMLGANYTTIGIGRAYVAGSPYGWYWTTDFGSFDDGWSYITTAAPARRGRASLPNAAPSSALWRRHQLIAGAVSGQAP